MVENDSVPLSRRCCSRRSGRFREEASSLPSIHSCSINRVLTEGCFGTNEAIRSSFFLKESKDSFFYCDNIHIYSILYVLPTNINEEGNGFEKWDVVALSFR
jgi:hypothetical protein